jgi:hypothetical protein
MKKALKTLTNRFMTLNVTISFLLRKVEKKCIYLSFNFSFKTDETRTVVGNNNCPYSAPKQGQVEEP